MTDYAVRLSGVSKTYGSLTAVEQLSLNVPQGSMYGFIGPNGSGKTTTLRLILHLIFPDSGDIEVLNTSETRAANDRIGYLPEERGLYKKMTVARQIAYFARLKGMSGPAIREATAFWLERLSLEDRAKNKIESLSKGMVQKVQFITAVISRPDLLILDEPFSGLDPLNLELIRDIILELRKAGTTVIFSTHDMAMAERMCDTIFMICRGRKVLDGSLSEIQQAYGADTIRLRLSGTAAIDFHHLPGVEAVRDLGRYHELRFNGDSHSILRTVTAHSGVELFEVVRPSLHDIFVRIAGSTREEETADG